MRTISPSLTILAQSADSSLTIKNPNPLRTGPWNLTDLESVQKIGRTVLSTFSCGGGSTMGYKLAGYDVIGCVEIDPEMMSVYKANHNPKYPYLMGVGDFNKIPNIELPPEFMELDILDGSPPCSSFSKAGSREKKWGKNTHFREGQAKQVLDDLFFDFVATAKKLQPKVVVAENVKGLIQGNAKGYVKQIFQGFRDAGYSCQLFLLNASRMGVPQRRERTFFVGNRLGKKLELCFDEPGISLKTRGAGRELTGVKRDRWLKIRPGQGLGEIGGFNSQKKIHKNGPTFTLTATLRHWHHTEPREISDLEIKELSSFPDDYRAKDVGYLCGMSVPPFMMQRVATAISEQLLNVDQAIKQ